MLLGVLEPTSGDVLVGGASVVTDKSAVARQTGYCPQFGGQWPNLTLREHLELFAGLRGFGLVNLADSRESGGDIELNPIRGTRGGSGASESEGAPIPRVAPAPPSPPPPSMKAMLDQVEAALGLSEHSGKLVKHLSGGTQRKLATALALIGAPNIVYLDGALYKSF